MLKRTALFEEHQKLNGKMVDFGGWELPVQYSGVLTEHTAVRIAAGLFDVSHMGEILISGPGSLEFVNYLVTNDVSTLAINQAQYSAMCNEMGGIVDDLVIYRTSEQTFFIVVNASNTEKDFQHISTLLSKYIPPAGTPKPKIENQSSLFSQIAIQGPLAQEILEILTSTNLSDIKTYWCKPGTIRGADGKSINTLFARTGYTGEDGFELYIPWAEAPSVWQALLEVGKPVGLMPCGLGARDTLRLEMKYALYGHELSDDTTPLETGLGWVTKLAKPDFYGKTALLAQKEKGITKTLVGVKSLGRAIPRQGYEIYSSQDTLAPSIGTITSGTSSPSLKLPIGVAFIQKNYEKIGTHLWVKVREDLHAFEVIKTPFYERAKK